MILEAFLIACWAYFLYFFEKSDFVKNRTPLKREHDFQGSGGSGNATFLLFVGVWCLDWLGDRFLWILDPF